MPKSAAPKTITARTTTLKIEPPPTYDNLAERYTLVRYELSDGLKFGKSDLNFARVHNAMKDGLDAPYRLFTHDQQNTHWAVYALHPKAPDASQGYTVAFEDSVLAGQPVPYTSIPYHVLVKLLQVAYFRSAAKHPGRFVGQDKCFIQVMKDKKRTDFYLCLEMEVKQTPNSADNVFWVDEHACYFGRVDKEEALANMHRRYYYAQVMAPGGRLVAFHQLKRREIQTATQALFTLRRYSSSRPVLDYHAINADEMEQTRGYHLYQFIDGFTAFLKQLGFEVTPLQRVFNEYGKTNDDAFTLTIEQLNTVYVLDIRFAKNTIPLTPFLAAYCDLFTTVAFKPILSLDELEQIPAPAVLIFQDAEKAAFDEGGPLHNGAYVDQYDKLYSDYPHIPKQFVNVNSNDLEAWKDADSTTGKSKKHALTAAEYLAYKPPAAEGKARKSTEARAKVVMN